MVDVPWPISTNPGKKPQEGTGRLINAFAEPRGDKSPVWRRAPGATVFARVPSSGSASMSFDANARGAVMFSTFFELVGSSTTVIVAGSTDDIIYPSGTAAGDMVFVFAGYNNTTGATAWTTPEGFAQLILSSTGAGSPLGYTIMYKASTGEPGINQFANPGASQLAALAVSIRGANTTDPINQNELVSSATANMPNPPDITPTTADTLIVTAGFLKDNVITATTAPTGFAYGTHTQTGAGDLAVMVAFYPTATTTTVAVSSFQGTRFDSTVVNTTVASGHWIGATFALRHD
jgi:hypothetical protein